MNELLASIDEAAVAAGAARGVRGESVDYEVGGVLVAIVGPAGAEFRLGPEFVAAALGTPDTDASPRGPGWVAFRPRRPDRFALDRARAWLALAARVSLRPSGPLGSSGPPASPAR